MKGVTLPTETVFVMEMSPIKFGLGAMEEIGFDANRLGVKKALVFTDRNLAELGLPERVRALLEEQGIKADVYDGVEIEPTDRSMEGGGGVRAHEGVRRRTSSPATPRRSSTTSTSPWAAACPCPGRSGRSSPCRRPRGPGARRRRSR